MKSIVILASESPEAREPANFISSEVHVDRFGDELTYAALGFQGVPLNDPDALALSVLQLVLGWFYFIAKIFFVFVDQDTT